MVGILTATTGCRELLSLGGKAHVTSHCPHVTDMTGSAVSLFLGLQAVTALSPTQQHTSPGASPPTPTASNPHALPRVTLVSAPLPAPWTCPSSAGPARTPHLPGFTRGLSHWALHRLSQASSKVQAWGAVGGDPSAQRPDSFSPADSQ